jgi:hypothetical protein
VPTVPPSPPSAPGAVTAQAGNASVSLTWAAANPHGSPITRYDITWTGGAGGSQSVGGGQTNLAVKGLTNGATYTFSVSATNAIGTGPASLSNPATPTSAIPDPPTSVVATAKDKGTVDVSWPAANGQGHVITSYTVFVTDQTVGTQPRSVGQATTTTYNVPAATLTPGNQYTFTVTSTNDANGTSQPSPASTAVTAFTKASAPTNVQASGKDTQVDLKWNAPTDLGGGTLKDYIVSDQSGTIRQTASTSMSFTGLSNGTQYGFGIAAETTANGQTVQGAVATARATPGTAPTLSGESANSNGSTNSITVSFTVDTHNSGTVNCSAHAGPASWSGQCSGGVNQTLSGLNANTTYTVTIDASNNYGAAGQWSGQAATAKPPPSISIAKGPAYNGSGCSGPCQWISVRLQNFTPNMPYSVQCNDNAGGGFYAFHMTTDGNGNAYTDGTNPSTCYFGYPGKQIWVDAGGVQSNHITW